MTAKPEVILFDWDGTLVDSVRFLHAAHSYAHEKLSMPVITLEQFVPYFGVPRDVLYQEIYGDNHAAAMGFFNEFVQEKHLEALSPLPGAQDLLVAVRDMGLPCGIVSNKRPDFIRAEVEALGWEHYFLEIVGSGDAAQDKPAADPHILALARLGLADIDRATVWYIGDTESDLASAAAAGLISVFIQHTEAEPDYISKYKPIAILKNCHSVRDFLLHSRVNTLKG